MNVFQLMGIEQELLSLIKLKHTNLVKYFAMHYSKDVGKITVYVSHSVSHLLCNYGGGLQCMLHYWGGMEWEY